MVKCTENFYLKKADVQLIKKSAFTETKALLLWILQPMAGFTLSLVSEVHIFSVFV